MEKFTPMEKSAFFKTKVSSNYFEVRNEISLKTEESDFKASSTYEIVMKKTPDEDYDLFVDRLKFKVNGKEIENKFSKVSDEYFKCIFPIKLLLNDENFELANYEEIKNRIIEKDRQLQDEMEGDGLKYIRDQFFEKTNSYEKLSEFIFSLGIIKTLESAMQRYSFEKKSKFDWTSPIVGKTVWQLKNADEAKVSGEYIYQNSDQSELLNYFNQYRIENNLEEIKEEVLIKSALKQQINYENETLFFTESKTEISIKIGSFLDYQETLFLKSVM